MNAIRHVRIRGRVQGVGFRAWVQWAALECVLKMRGLGIAGLMRSDARVRRAGRRLWVQGIGPDASLRVIDRPEFVVVWGSEELP